MLQHVRDYGSFDPNTIDQAIVDFNTLGSNSEHTPINLQPVRQARMRSTHHIGPSALHPMTPSSPATHTIEVAPLEESDEDPSDMMLESEMNDMVEAIFEATDPTADDMKQEAHVAHGGGTSKRKDTTLEEKINRFCMLHHPTMDKWLTTYETAKEERYDARRAFRARQRGRIVRYPPELEVLPRFMPLLWLHQQLTKAEEEGVHVSLEEWEFSRGCSDKYKSYSAAWSRGRHFGVDHIDKKRVTFDSGVMAKFEQASQRRATDQNIVIAEMQYFGLLKEIINADYRSFTILNFDVQWFKVIMEGPNATVQRDVSGFIEVDSTKPWSDLWDTFVLPEHCEQVIFYPKPSDERWWYVIEVAPRGARIYEKYNLITVADAKPIETEVAELPDIDMTMPEDDVEPIEIEVAEMPEDDIVDLNDIDFSLGGELTVDLEVGIELCQDAVENT
ncbi:hypothetical protein L7F22_020104 [Adiantum nelumboides]|nr:hypothetical protein [Adiantum nelumboides]